MPGLLLDSTVQALLPTLTRVSKTTLYLAPMYT